MTNLVPYLTIYGKCEEALLFYQDCFGGEISFMQRYSEMEQDSVSEEFKNKIAHAEFVADNVNFFASDGAENNQLDEESNVTMTVLFETKEEQKNVFDKLKIGGNVTMDFTETSTNYFLVGLVDTYGIHWYLNCNE